MSAPVTTSIFKTSQPDGEKSHRLRMNVLYAIAGLGIIVLAIYGSDYYLLSSAERPFSPKHMALRPNGSIGLWLGVFGTVMFFVIFLYPLRKRWDWLRSKGNTRHWLDFHVLLGLSAPFVIAFHASFKFRGVAGMAFWIMSAVALSGVIGRYLYAQIPRSLSAAELSLQDVRDEQAQLTQQLTAQRLFSASALAPLFHLPDERRVQSQSMLIALAMMMGIDFLRFLHISRLRLRALNFWACVATAGGLLASRNEELERVIVAARRQAALAKRILFLSRSQQVFHLWHVVHKPFSYSFAVLAVLHIVVVMLFGVR
jgi:hypothetical protein